MIVPTSFNFPHTVKLLSISFILFAGWFADAARAAHGISATCIDGTANLIRQHHCRSAVPARPVPHPGRYVPAVSRHRRHQLEIWLAARCGPHGGGGAARKCGDRRCAALQPGAHWPLCCGHGRSNGCDNWWLASSFRHRSSGKLCR